MSPAANALTEYLQGLEQTVAELRSRMEELERKLEDSPGGAELLTIREFSEKHPRWTQGRLRSLRFHRQKNGFAKVFVEVPGAPVRIDEKLFFEMLRRPGVRRRS